MKKFIKAAAVCAALAMLILSVTACATEKKIVGSWKTRPQVDEGGAVIETPAEEVLLFVFNSDGTGEQTLPEYGDTMVMAYNWSVKGDTLTITSDDGEFLFTVGIKDDILTMIPEFDSDKTYEYIRVS